MKAAAIVVLMATCSFAETVWYVKSDATPGQNGRSWGQAFTTLEEALAAAAPGDEVWVAGGQYQGPITLAAFVSLYGGFRGTEKLRAERDWIAFPTTIDGHNKSTTVIGAEAAIIDGFTITGGSGEFGGGVYLEDTYMTFANCRIERNRSRYGGGGVLMAGSWPSFSNVYVGENETESYGGGIYVFWSWPTFEDCEISRNIAWGGGGVMTDAAIGHAWFTRCRFTGNRRSGLWGGGATLVDCRLDRNFDGAVLGGATLIGCEVCFNWSEWNGGGFNGCGHIQECVFYGNQGFWGGAIALTGGGTIINSRIYGNEAMYRGGGIHCNLVSHHGDFTIINTLVYGNKASHGGGMVLDNRERVVHCTVAQNSGLPARDVYAQSWTEQFEISHSILWSGQTEGSAQNELGATIGGFANSLVDRDPLFVMPATLDFGRYVKADVAGEDRLLPDFIVREGDFHLEPGSPGVDSGSRTALVGTDLDGNPRPCGRRSDLGAFEGCAAGEPFFRRGDANGDGVVNLADAVVLLSRIFRGGLLACPDAADANDDGSASVADAIFLLDYVFRPPLQMPAPYPACGRDETFDYLGSCTYEACE